MKRFMKFSHAAVCAGIFSLFVFSACQNNKEASTTPDTTVDEKPKETGKIAYVNLDSLEAKYEFWSAKKVDFEKRQRATEAELERLGRNLQTEAANFQKKAQSGSFTSQSEAEAAQMKLAKMQQELENRHQTVTEGLMKEQQEFNTELQKRLDNFLAEYNKDMRYAYILSYSKSGGVILFADPALDITDEVVEGLNNANKKSTKDDGQSNSK